MKKKLINYNECQWNKMQHILVYIAMVLISTVVLMLFYHNIALSLAIGLIVGIFLKKMLIKSVIDKRKKQLRLQFKTFLESMTVAVRAGQNELVSLQSALDDLKLTYNGENDIIVEIDHIIKAYRNADIPLSDLFLDFGNRSGIEDIKTFGTIFMVISGKSDNFATIINQTQQIISDKIEIESEIETSITSVKSELLIMFVIPLIMVVSMSSMGGDTLNVLFTTPIGWVISTIAIVIFVVAFIIAQKFTDIKF